jgi:hypothetical protein
VAVGNPLTKLPLNPDPARVTKVLTLRVAGSLKCWQVPGDSPATPPSDSESDAPGVTVHSPPPPDLTFKLVRAQSGTAAIVPRPRAG